MKRVIAIALCLCIAFGLVACEEAAGSAPGDSASIPDLYAAVEKLAEADSFRITTERNDGIKPATYIDQIAHIDGELRMLCYSKAYANANTLVEGTSYFEGNVQYQVFDYIQRKTIYEDGYQITQIVCGDLVGDTKAFLDAFLETEPQCQTKNGMTVLSKKLPKEEYISLAYKIFSFIDEDYFALGKATVSVTVDSEGYLREVALKADLLGARPSITFTIDQINEIDSLEAPDYAKNFVSNIGVRKEPLEDSMDSEVYIIKGDVAAVYTNTPIDLETRGGWMMGGFEGEAGIVVPCHEILEQIDGFPVLSAVPGNYGNNKAVVERVVISKGVKISNGGEYGYGANNMIDTVLFFCDAEENVLKSFYVLGDPYYDGESYCYKAAYYAGEWEYVDGIPTPLN